jgi:hypothetical protein
LRSNKAGVKQPARKNKLPINQPWFRVTNLQNIAYIRSISRFGEIEGEIQVSDDDMVRYNKLDHESAQVIYKIKQRGYLTLVFHQSFVSQAMKGVTYAFTDLALQEEYTLR